MGGHDSLENDYDKIVFGRCVCTVCQCICVRGGGVARLSRFTYI